MVAPWKTHGVSSVGLQRSHSKKTLRLNFTWSLASTQWAGWAIHKLPLERKKGRQKETKKIIICLVVLVHVFTYKFSLLD
jgi:hypothetical protein